MNMMVLLMLMIWSMNMNDDAENHADDDQNDVIVGDDGDDVTDDGDGHDFTEDHDKMILVTIVVMEDGEQHS